MVYTEDFVKAAAEWLLSSIVQMEGGGVVLENVDLYAYNVICKKFSLTPYYEQSYLSFTKDELDELVRMCEVVLL